MSIPRSYMLGQDVTEKENTRLGARYPFMLTPKQNLDFCYRSGVKVATCYAFSIDNFKRPNDQVDFLMELFKVLIDVISAPGGELHRNCVALRVLGQTTLLPLDLQKEILRTTELTKENGGNVVNICLAYTSRDEISSAIRATVASSRGTENVPQPVCFEVNGPRLVSANVTMEMLNSNMLIVDDSPLDLLVRSSGTNRLSDFLLWQCHQNTDLAFVNSMWPEFRTWQLFSVLWRWQRRQPKRRSSEQRQIWHDIRIQHVAYVFIYAYFSMCAFFSQCYNFLDRIPSWAYQARTPESILRDVKWLKRIPSHLGVILTPDRGDEDLEKLMKDVAELIVWSMSAGVPVLNIYESTGILKSSMSNLQRIITDKVSSLYPSNEPGFRLFASHCGTQGFHLSIQSNDDAPTSLALFFLSSTDGRDTILEVTKTLAQRYHDGKLSLEDINIDLIDNELQKMSFVPRPLSQSDDGLEDTLLPTTLESVKSEPDLLIIFGQDARLHGYPPWQIRLSEIFCTGRSNVVTYRDFLKGLCLYAGAEMRFGR
ncbi:di-trans,poly-cis-decaprenylcistransferase [Helicocarpus griseus UAMH5409]|uniref:Di-trans,poly-cis-decaprenylcistransferase n=1 Tax=Helicocarpus griseus UAMH5409 TaxID=1447875 RepID=A0A2B7WUT9_9EURO|nr:di-trans,poly-cis-decaprenylcistransferase [Helicocarpus griseus UAMH5409]